MIQPVYSEEKRAMVSRAFLSLALVLFTMACEQRNPRATTLSTSRRFTSIRWSSRFSKSRRLGWPQGIKDSNVRELKKIVVGRVNLTDAVLSHEGDRSHIEEQVAGRTVQLLQDKL